MPEMRWLTRPVATGVLCPKWWQKLPKTLEWEGLTQFFFFFFLKWVKFINRLCLYRQSTIVVTDLALFLVRLDLRQSVTPDDDSVSDVESFVSISCHFQKWRVNRKLSKGGSVATILLSRAGTRDRPLPMPPLHPVPHPHLWRSPSC